MESEYTLLTELKGVGPTTASRLKKGGFKTIESIVITPKKEIMEKTGISEVTATGLIQKVREFSGFEFIIITCESQIFTNIQTEVAF